MRTAIFASASIVVLSFTLAPTGAAGAGASGSSQAMQQLRATATAPRMAQPATLGPSRTGQPNQSCGSATAPNTPGNAAQAPGSAFNPSGQAGSVYAGQQPQNSRNTASVAQYDVACFHQR